MRYAIVNGLGQDFVPGQPYTGVIGTGYQVVPQSNSDPAQMARVVAKPVSSKASAMMVDAAASPAMDLAHKTFMVAGGAALLYIAWQKFGKK